MKVDTDKSVGWWWTFGFGVACQLFATAIGVQCPQ